MLETVEIVKLDNGYTVKARTSRTVGNDWEAHYCSNLKGVVAHLYKTFEGMTKLSKDQLEFIKTGGKDTK